VKIGSRVTIKHGSGVIVGKDMPEIRCWRWVVKVDNPKPEHAEMVRRFKNAELCYFHKNVKEAAHV